MPSHTATTHVTQCVGGVLAHSSVAASNSAATESSIWSNYPGTSSISLGIVHIIVGLLCVVCNAISIVTHSPLAVVGSGIWGGAFFVLTGAFGVAAGKQRTTCTIVTFLVLSILAASVFVVFVLGLSIAGVVVDNHHERWLPLAMNAVLLVLSVVELTVAIWSSVIGCTICGGLIRSDFVDFLPISGVINFGDTQMSFTTRAAPSRHIACPHQQGFPEPADQRQHFPCTPKPQQSVVYPPQYNGGSAPPPYTP